MLFSCVIYAQPPESKPSWKETYKKAYAFTTTNPDSALVYAKKCLRLSKTPQQTYSTYYFIGYNAKLSCFFGLAKYSYDRAVGFAVDSVSKYNAINELASTLLNAGDLPAAYALNEQNIDYFLRSKEQRNLGYAYQLQGVILRHQNKYSSIEVLRNALALQHVQAPAQVGYTYDHLAQTFANFHIYDSAVAYQRQAVLTYPIKTPDKTAYMKVLLARYLIFADQLGEAKELLLEVKNLSKKPLTDIHWCHTYALYLQQTQQDKAALQAFIHCDSLVEASLGDAGDVITRQTLATQARKMYEDILNLPDLPVHLAERYRGKLKTTEVRLASYTRELKLKDRLYLQQFAGSSSVQKGGGSSLFWVWCLLAGLLFLVGLDRYYHHRLSLMFSPSPATLAPRAAAPVVVPEPPLVADDTPVVVENKEPTESANDEANPEPDPTLEEVAPEETASKGVAEDPPLVEETPVLTPSLTPAELYKAQALLHEEELVWLIEQQTGKPLSPKVRDMVRYYYQGLSIQEVAKEMGTKFDHVRYRFRTIVKDTEFKTMRALMDAYRSGELRRAAGDDDAADEKA